MTPIVHITDKEQALQRENANMLDTINKQAVSIEKLRKVVEMKDLTIEAQAAEIAALKAQPVQPALKELSDAEIDTVTVAHFRKPILPMFRGFARSIWNLRTGGAG